MKLSGSTADRSLSDLALLYAVLVREDDGWHVCYKAAVQKFLTSSWYAAALRLWPLRVLI